MCMLGTIDIIDQHTNSDNDTHVQLQADLVLVAGESTDHLVLAVSECLIKRKDRKYVRTSFILK